MSYPSSYDSITNVSANTLITSAQTNTQINAINAIEVALGLTPYGPYATIAAAIAGKLDANFVTDTGSTNAYAVTLSPAPVSYTAGLRILFKATHANTGSSTLNVNSLGAKTIYKSFNTALVSGDILAGQLVEVVYDGTNFQAIGIFNTISTGTITSGTWQGTPIAILYGGTGATTASGARSNLSAAQSGTNSDITNLTGLANNLSLNSHRLTSVSDPTALTDAMNAETEQNSSVIYAADSGTTNAYAVTLSPAPASYTAGMKVIFLAANSNTGASTLNVNSLGARTITKQGIVNLQSGDIASGQIISVVYDGSDFQIVNTFSVPSTYSGGSSISTVGTISSGTWAGTTIAVAHGGTGATTAAGALSNLGAAASGENGDITSMTGLLASDSGSANTYVVTLSPAPGSYVSGLMLAFNVGHTNTSSSTLNVNSLGAKTIKKQGSTNLESGDLAAGQIAVVMYDGTNFQLINTLQVSPTYAGGSSIATVGTIGTGTWQGTVVGTTYGGTGANVSAPALGTLLAGTGSVFNALTVGTNGFALVADSTATLGVKWGNPHKMAMATKTGNYTIASTDTYIRADATSNNVTITLPDATATGSSSANQWFEIKRIDSSGHTVTINTTSSQTIDGSTSTTLASNATLRVMSNNSNWDII